MAGRTQQTVTKQKISKLKDHPQQAEMFGHVDDAELEALAENMRKHGLRVPIEITPDGTVITGHQRMRAAKRLGWKVVDVLIRHDLAALGPAAIEERFVEDNFLRRQLSPLVRAKCIKRIMELEEQRDADHFGCGKKEELKQRIAARMGLSARSVSRYLLLLTAPAAIQTAFDRGQLTLTVAGKIALLPRAVKAEIANRIEGGEKPAAVIAAHTRAGGATASPARAFVRLVRCLRRELSILSGHEGDVRPVPLATSRALLEQARAVLAELVAAAGRKAS